MLSTSPLSFLMCTLSCLVDSDALLQHALAPQLRNWGINTSEIDLTDYLCAHSAVAFADVASCLCSVFFDTDADLQNYYTSRVCYHFNFSPLCLLIIHIPVLRRQRCERQSEVAGALGHRAELVARRCCCEWRHCRLGASCL